MDNSKGKVTIEVDEYNELLLFKNNMELGYAVGYTWYESPSCYFLSKEEAIKQLSMRLDYAKQELKELKESLPVDKIKRMSVFEFIRWRRQ